MVFCFVRSFLKGLSVKDWVGSLATVLAIAGVLLNNRMDRRCFIVWIVSNLICLYLHNSARRRGASGMVAMIVRDIVFTVLSAHGYMMWSGKV